MAINAQYSVIKYIHSPIRDEILNVGVILSAPELKDSRILLDTDLQRVASIFPDAEINNIKNMLEMIEDQSNFIEGNLSSFVQGSYGAIRFTDVRGAICEDLDVEIEDLYSSLVGVEREPVLVEGKRPRITDDVIRKDFMKSLRKRGVSKYFQKKEVREMKRVQCKSGDEYIYDMAYRNENYRFFKCISFDLEDDLRKINNARIFASVISDTLALPNYRGSLITAVVQPPNDGQSAKAYEIAKKLIINQKGFVVETKNEPEMNDLLEEIASTIKYIESRQEKLI